MRYCKRCGFVMDEFDSWRDKQNCPICSGMWSEDDMTALKYAELSESEKDAYDEQLYSLIINNPNFDKGAHYRNGLNIEDGWTYVSFRPEKMFQYDPHVVESASKDIIEAWIQERKANEPFKPFPPIDIEKAREVAINAERTHRELMNNLRQSTKKNIPRCPICQSTNLEKLSKLSFRNSFGFNLNEGGAPSIIPIIGMRRNNKTWKCRNCGSKF